MSAVALAGCARCTSPLERGDLRCAVCALPAPVVEAAVAAERARVLRCKECNAAVAFSPDAQAPRCAFCGAVMEVEQLVDPLEEARVRIPFAVDRDAATGALRGWLSTRGWFAPRTLADEAVVDSLAPLYWAGWLVDAPSAVDRHMPRAMAMAAEALRSWRVENAVMSPARARSMSAASAL